MTPTISLYENMIPIEHVLRQSICVFSHLMCVYKHFNVSYLYIIEHIEVADEFITSKNIDFTRYFIIKPRHPSRLKNRSGWKKPSVGALVTCGKTPTTIT